MTKFLRCARRVSNYGCRGASAGRTRSRTRRGNMPRGGSKPGERRGGRKKGSLSEATIERALKAERELVNANETGKSSPRNISKISRSLRTNVSFHGRWVRGRDRGAGFHHWHLCGDVTHRLFGQYGFAAGAGAGYRHRRRRRHCRRREHRARDRGGTGPFGARRVQEGDGRDYRPDPRHHLRAAVGLCAGRRTHTCSGTPAAFSLPTRAPTRAPCRRISAIATSSTPCATLNFRPRASRTSGATDADCPISAKKVVGTRAEGLQDSFWAAVLTWRWRKSTSVRSTSAKLAPPS